MKKTLIAILKIVLPLAIGVYLIWHYYNQMSQEDRETTIYAIQHANYFWLLLSVLIGFASHLSRSYRWKYTLEPLGYKPKFWHLYHGVMIGYIVNLTIPRSGEASRAGFLYNSDRIPFTKSFGTIIAERAIDLIALGTITLITIGMQYSKVDEIQKLISGYGEQNPKEEGSGLGTYILVGVGLLFLIGLILVLTNKKIKTKVMELIGGVWEGVKSIFKSKNPGGFLLHTVIIWVCYIAMFIIAFKALPSTSNMPIGGSLAAFIAGTVGLLFIPGGIGAYPALVAIITTFYLFPEHYADGENSGPHPQAYAIGWLIWLAQTALIVGLGIISLVLGSMIKKKTIHHEQTGNPSA